MKELHLRMRFNKEASYGDAIEVLYLGKWRHLGFTHRNGLPSRKTMMEVERIFHMNSGIKITECRLFFHAF